MNPPIAVNTSALRAAIAKQLSPSHGHVAIVLPTTHATLAVVDALACTGDIDAVIGTWGDSGKSPAWLLNRLAERDSPRQRIIVFTDQLTSPTNATLYVSRNGASFWLSALESAIHGMYPVKLSILIGNDFPKTDTTTSTAEILRLQHDHLHAASRLGNDWLARYQQSERTPAMRMRQAKIRLRRFHSATLHHAITIGDIPLMRLALLHQQMNELYRAYDLQAGASHASS